MPTKQINTETIFYAFAFILALGLRFLNLGVAPLSDSEAEFALQAWDFSRGALSQPSYFALTRGIFFLLGSSSALARLWPALSGSILVLIPSAFRSLLGRKAALILAFGLALDPGLIAISRAAGSPMMAIAFIALALMMFYRKKPASGGVFSALALLSGPSIWIAFSGTLIFGLLLLNWDRNRIDGSNSTFPLTGMNKETIAISLKFGLAVYILVSTFAFSSSLGLGAFGGDAAAYFRGWATPSGISPSRIIMALIMYMPLAVIFAFVIGIEHEEHQRLLVRKLALWAFAFLVVLMVYPGRQVVDAAWVLIPVWVLAAMGISRYGNCTWQQLVVWGQAAAQFVVLILIWLILAGSFHLIDEAQIIRITLFSGLLIFSSLTFIFVGLGWSWLAARQGLALGFGSALVVYSFAAVFGVSQVFPANPAELWLPQTSIGQEDLLLETITDLSMRKTGQGNSLDGIILIDSPALRWSLRDYQDIIFLPSLDTDQLAIPSVILALPAESGTLLATAYRGQNFIWQMRADTTGALPSNWESWLIFRESPLEVDEIVLWVHDDLFSLEPAGQ
ncbi:MAG: hypothetical protein ABFS03_00285 [Chloroflexota bacterium]